ESCSHLSLSLSRCAECTGAQRRPVEGTLQCRGGRSHEEGCAQHSNAQGGEQQLMGQATFNALTYLPSHHLQWVKMRVNFQLGAGSIELRSSTVKKDKES